MRFYYCSICNQLQIQILDSGNKMSCCENPVDELISHQATGEGDEHRPIIRKIGNFVSITVEDHPMIDVHYLSFIFMETNQGFQYKYLVKNSLPKADFILAKNEEIVNVYVFCNVHLLWSLN